MDELSRREAQLVTVNKLLGSVDDLLRETRTDLGLSRPRSTDQGIVLEKWQQEVADLVRDTIGQIGPAQITALQKYLDLQREYLQDVIIRMGGTTE